MFSVGGETLFVLCCIQVLSCCIWGEGIVGFATPRLDIMLTTRKIVNQALFRGCWICFKSMILWGVEQVQRKL